MASFYGRKFDAVLRKLRQFCPSEHPVKVVTADLRKDKLCGSCVAYITADGQITRFLIEIARDNSEATAVDTLLHEWAHVLDKEANGLPSEPHRNSWGEYYAKVWRCYVNEVSED